MTVQWYNMTDRQTQTSREKKIEKGRKGDVHFILRKERHENRNEPESREVRVEDFGDVGGQRVIRGEPGQHEAFEEVVVLRRASVRTRARAS